MMRAHRQSLRRVALLAIMVCMSGGLVWGLATAATASPSTSPAAGKVILRIGWTREPDNLNPFIGYSPADYEVWHLQYDLLVGTGQPSSNPSRNSLRVGPLAPMA